MFLAVDIGNSYIKFGTFDGENLISKFSIATTHDLTVEQLRNAAGQSLRFPIADILVCSVVPQVRNAISDFLSVDLGVAPVFVNNEFDFGLKFNYEPLTATGTDRLVNAFAAASKYGFPCLACSLGTATTIDVVDEHGLVPGGVIAPGIKSMARALHLNTSQLPEVALEMPPAIIQTATSGSIQSGLIYGYFGMVKELILRMKSEVGGDPKVVATGGFSRLVAENTSLVDIVDENLLLDGLRLLAKRMDH